MIPFSTGGPAVTWTNMPAAETLLFGGHVGVTLIDLAAYTQCRLVVNKQGTAGLVGSKVILKYATTFQTTAAGYLAIGTAEISVPVNTTNTVAASAWINLVAGAKADVFVAVTGIGGNGTLDPAFGSITAQCR